MTIPINEVLVSQTHPSSRFSGSVDREERRATLRVLVVDDLPEIRYLLEVALSREAKVRLVGQAENGQQALEKIELLRPDLVVMDLQMPVVDGVEATRGIREQWPDVEVVGFTSSANVEGGDAMRAAGATASFEKNEMKELLELIRDRAGSRGGRSSY